MILWSYVKEHPFLIIIEAVRAAVHVHMDSPPCIIMYVELRTPRASRADQDTDQQAQRRYPLFVRGRKVSATVKAAMPANAITRRDTAI